MNEELLTKLSDELFQASCTARHAVSENGANKTLLQDIENKLDELRKQLHDVR